MNPVPVPGVPASRGSGMLSHVWCPAGGCRRILKTDPLGYFES